jgi:hypothetical protein
MTGVTSEMDAAGDLGPDDPGRSDVGLGEVERRDAGGERL